MFEPGPHDTFVARKTVTSPWEEWFAWYPVTIHRKRVWLKKIYRRKHDAYVDNDKFTRHEYGTVFDVLRGI